MHVITKILVVFAAVLSILLAALAIAYSTNAQRITSQFMDERLAKQAAQTQLGQEKTENALAQSRLEQQINDLTGQIGEIRRDKESLMLDNGRLLADAKTAEAAAMSVQARIDQLVATSQTQATLIDSMYQEVSKLRENELRYAQREIEYTDRFNDLTSQLEVARETNRALQEQIAQIQADRSRAGGPASASAPRSVNAPIQARVTNVRKDPGGRMLAEIDAGSSDRIVEGMELNIVRGQGEFVAMLRIDRVSLNESVGRIDTLNRQVEVRPGDLVISSAIRRQPPEPIPMSQFGMQMPGSVAAARRPSMNVYTGLMFGAVVCLAAAVALVWQAGALVSPKQGPMAPFELHPAGQVQLPNARP